ncbi:hypothetical protein GQ44DRAFT_775237 [Phaeosphaeriaceae sp. PMI808]|nr:hypothetical protein GQ44DRAFT_775237 [Phaeosphaeriaceae sp. PMI808]
MTSGKADSRASDVEDVGVNIERWQADTVVQKDHETGTGPIGLLFNSLIELLRFILIDIKKRLNMSEHYQSLESSSAALFFWGADLGVARGELDEALQDSSQLRDTCLLVLVSIGQFIISSFVRLLSNKDRQKEILDSTDIVPILEKAMNILDKQHYSAHQPEQNEEDLCRTLRMKIDTLIMLGPSLESPAEENFDDEEPRAIEHVEGHLPEQTYINSVAQRFPLAAPTVVTRLGKLNWERYNHMLHLQRNAIQQELEMTVLEKAKTIFHDSALGSSVPAQSEAGPSATCVHSIPQTVYVPSVVSSRAEASHRRLPPLPPQARSGQPFTCVICNKQVRYQRTKAWKKHIFDDILAYACLFPECTVADVFFEDRYAMMSHLEQCHDLDVSVSKVTCPLCFEYTSEDRDALSLHFARHMEETALAVLPSGVDSDDESVNDTPSEAETRTEKRISSEGLVTVTPPASDSDFYIETPGADSSSSESEDEGSNRATARGFQQADVGTNSNVDFPNMFSHALPWGKEIMLCSICSNQEFPDEPWGVGNPRPNLINSLVGGLFIKCCFCLSLQHRRCAGILDEAAEPESYLCVNCHEKGATESKPWQFYSKDYPSFSPEPSVSRNAPSPSSSVLGQPSISELDTLDTLFCLKEGCKKTFGGKNRRASLQRHMRLKHINEEEREYTCEANGCGRIFKRPDARLRHHRAKHPELGVSGPVRRKA